MAHQWLRVKCTFSSTCAGQLGHVHTGSPDVTLVSNTASTTAQTRTYNTVFECPLMPGDDTQPRVSQGLQINFKEDKPLVSTGYFSAFKKFSDGGVNTLSSSVSTWTVVSAPPGLAPCLDGAFVFTVLLECGKCGTFILHARDNVPVVYSGSCGLSDEYTFRFEAEVLPQHERWDRRVQRRVA